MNESMNNVKLTQEELNKIVEQVRNGQGENAEEIKVKLGELEQSKKEIHAAVKSALQKNEDETCFYYDGKEISLKGLSKEQVRIVRYMILSRQADILLKKEAMYKSVAVETFIEGNDNQEEENNNQKNVEKEVKTQKVKGTKKKETGKNKDKKKAVTVEPIDYTDVNDLLGKINGINENEEEFNKLKTAAAKNMPKNEKRKEKWLKKLAGLVGTYNYAVENGAGKKDKKKAFKKIKNKVKGGNWFVRWIKGIGLGIYGLVKSVVWPLVKPVVRFVNKSIVKPIQKSALKSQEREASKLKYQKVLKLTDKEKAKCKKAREKANKKHEKLGLPELECNKVKLENLKEENIKEIVELFGEDRLLDSIDNREEVAKYSEEYRTNLRIAKLMVRDGSNENIVSEKEYVKEACKGKCEVLDAVAEALKVESDMDAIAEKVKEISEQLKDEKKNKKSKEVNKENGASREKDAADLTNAAITPDNTSIRIDEDKEQTTANAIKEELEKDIKGKEKTVARTTKQVNSKSKSFVESQNTNGDSFTKD